MKQTLKRMLSLTLVLCMLLSMLPTSVFAATGNANDPYIYEVQDDATVTEREFEEWISQYNLACNVSGSSENHYRYRVVGATNWNEFSERYTDYYTKTLTNGATYEIQRRSSTGLVSKTYYWGTSYYFTFKVYHNITATIATDSDANATGAGVTVANSGKVYNGETATIAVNDVADYKAEIYNGTTLVTTLNDETGWTYQPTITASTDYTVKYVSTKAPEYDITLETVNADGTTTAYGSAELGKTSGQTGDKIALTVTPDNVNTTVYDVAVTAGDATYDPSTGQVTVGSAASTVTVTFSKLTGNETASVKFNAYKPDGTNVSVSNQMVANKTYYADVDAKQYLEDEILDSLNIRYNGTKLSSANATIQYFPYYTSYVAGNANGNGYSDEDGLQALNATRDDTYWLGAGWKFSAFGARGLDKIEKVRISYTNEDGVTLYVDAEITLVDGRQEVTITNSKNGSSYDVTDETSMNAVKTEVQNATTIESGEVEVTTNYEWSGNLPTAAGNKAETISLTVSVPESANNQSAEETFTFTANLKQFNISWDTDADGDVDETTKVYYNARPVAPDPVAKENNSATWPDIAVATEDRTYTVIYSPDTIYTVKYVTNIENYNIADQTYNVTANPTVTVAAPTVEDQPNKIFDGWFTDAEFKNAYTFGTTPDASITLYAKWSNDKYDNNVRDENETVTIIINTEKGNGTVTIDGTTVTNGDYIFDSTKTNTIIATPSDLKGSDGSAGYVAGVVTTNTLSSSYSGGVYTGTGKLTDGETVTVTFKTASLTNKGGTLELNGYHTTTNYDARWDNIDTKTINAVLGGGTVTDYTVYYWLNPSWGADPGYYKADNGYVLASKDRLTVPEYGKTGTLKVKIVKNASTDGKFVALTLADVNVTTKESRKPAQVSFSSAVSGKYDTEDLFKEAVAGTINVLDNNNADCKANAGLTVTLNPVEGKVNTYTVSYSLANDGATWLTTSGTLPGEVVWNISVYDATFNYKDASGTDKTVTREDVEYNKTAAVPSVPGYQTVDKVYTFAGWDTDGDTTTIELDKDATTATVTADVTYTAVFDDAARQYTVNFVADKNGNGSIEDDEILQTGKVAYGTVPTYTGKTPTKDSTNTQNFAFNEEEPWDKGIVAVTGDVTYTAQFVASTRYYTVTFMDYDGEELGTSTVEYGQAATAPTDPTRAADETYTYTFAGWDKAFDNITADDVVVTATYTPTYIDYTITWVYNGKTETKTYHYGDAIVAPKATNYVVGNTTYTFQGWDADGDDDTEVGETLPATVTENITYKAIYTDLTVWDVTVKYEDDTTPDATGKVEDGKTYTIPNAPTLEGYRFDGWYVGTTKVEAGSEYTIKTNTTIEAKWVKTYTVTYETEYHTAPEAKTYDVGTVITIADLLAVGDKTDSVIMDGWYIGEDKVSGEHTVTEDVTITAKWVDDTDNDNLVDGSTDDPYWIITIQKPDGTYNTIEKVLNGESYATPAAIDKDNAIFVEWNKTVDSTNHVVTFTAVWNTNDSNNNNVDDGSETGTVTLEQTGNGNVTLTPAGNATLLKQEGNVYTYLWDSTDVANKVIKVSTSLIDTNATDGNVDYVISAPATVNIGETVTVKFGTHTLNANGGTVKINKYYTGKSDKAALASLRTDILTAAGLSTDSKYVVTTQAGFQSINLVGTVEIYDGDAKLVGEAATYDWMIDEDSILAGEMKASSWPFTITDSTTGVSKSVTMTLKDSRSSAGLEDTEITDVKVLNDQQGLTDYVGSLANGALVNPNGVTVTVTLTEGAWPPAAAGITTKLVYTIKYADSADYIGDEAKLTVYVQSAYNNCTVVADSTLTAGGSLTVSPSNDNTTVAGNDTVTITVTPSGANVVETITVLKNGEAFATYATDKISYEDKAATVSFKSDGSTKADEYVVTATYSQNYLNLKEDQTIVYCVDDKNHTHDLQKMVFDAIFGGSSAPMTKDNVKLEFKYGHVVVDLWADVSKDPAINLNGISHKFGESGSETIKLTYSDAKYGSFEQTVVLNVFDSCYNVTVGVKTVTNGADATIKTQYSQDARKYLGVNYFKAGTSLTVTLTPDGAFLDTLQQMYNGTYADSMAYIKSVTVYDKNDDVVEATLTRDQGKLSLEGILQGVNPMLYNAAVTFTLAADESYKIVVEYGILELKTAEDYDDQMEMYQGGNDYAAKVPSVQNFISNILGGEYAADFLETYGGGFTVDFSTDLISYNWTAVSDEALLALNDGTEIKVRITWKPTDGDKTYYPVAVTGTVTLVDTRTPTSVAGKDPEKQVNFLSEDKLIAELKDAMGLGILANGESIDVDYAVTYNITGDETNGYFADVTVTYDGSANYKPASKTFDNVPVANRPDDATINITIQNASDVVTNNDGKIQSIDPTTGIYTVVGNGTYNFKFTPVSGKAIDYVTVNGEKAELTYDKGVATFSMVLTEKEHYEIVVYTVDSVWVLEDDRVYDFAYGVMDPVNKDIVDTAVKAPTGEAIDYSAVTVEYLAREEGTVTIELPDVDLGFTNIELGTFDIELGELWLDPNAVVTEYDMEKLLDELVADVIDKVSHGQLAATDAVSYMTEKLKGLTIGAHEFGSAGDGAVETIRISYADKKYTLAQVVTDVTIHDYRTATELVANDCQVTYGYSLADLLTASGAYVAADGAEVSGLKIETNDLYLHAGEETVTLYFAGDENNQPCEVTINVTVNKATVDIDYDSQFITYGDEYDFAIAIAPEKHNDGTEVKPDMIEFMIGLDMTKTLDFSEAQDIVGLGETVANIQLRLPEAIRELPLVGQYLQGEFTLSEFTNLINSLSDNLGIDEGSMEILNQVVEAITGITDNMEIKIIIKDEDFHPTNFGVYIAGAVTVDADYETAYTADYLIIAPTTNEVELDWNAAINNGLVILPAWNAMDKGASVVGDPIDGFNVKYLILGVNSDESEFLTTDIYGNIKANIWLDPEDVQDNGAYVQIAYGIKWGNELYYAIPIVRAFAITPGVVEVELVGATGEPNNELLKQFNNEPQGFNVIVKDENGEIVYSDHYQNAVDNLDDDNAQMVVYYTGIQTNGKLYNSVEEPVHAGVYTALAVYAEFNQDDSVIDLSKYTFENLDIENLDINELALDLYELFDLVCIGVDAGLLVIEPTTSTVTVEDKIVVVDPEKAYSPADQVVAGSTVPGLTPDTTIITAGIGSNGQFSENGWEAITGTVNVDFPEWVDKMLAQFAPGVVDGITISELSDKLVAKLPEITAALENNGASSEVLNSFENAVNSVVEVLAQMPKEIVLTFSDDITYTNVGTYIVVAAVTDSDHYPSVDAGLLVIAPDVTRVKLEWNYEDQNGIFTRELLDYVDVWATAYNLDTNEQNAEATAKITYQFIGIDSSNEPVIYTDPVNLPNGAYIELAYIELELDGKMIISDMIARPIVVVPSNVDVNFVDESGNANRDRKFTYDTTSHAMNVQAISNEGVDLTQYGLENDYLTVTYYGVQTDGTVYNSEFAPVHAGAYTAVATYLEKDENGQIYRFGMDVGAMVIEPAKASITVDNATKIYKAHDHLMVNDYVEVTPEDAKYTLIMGSISKEGDLTQFGLDAINGGLNIDFPDRIDAILSEIPELAAAYEVPEYEDWTEIRNGSGLTVEDFRQWLKPMAEELSSTLAEMGIELNQSYYQQLDDALTQLDEALYVTFLDFDEVEMVNPEDIGVYMVMGIVTDPDYYPAADTGIMVIGPSIEEIEVKWNQEFDNEYNYIFASQVAGFNWGATYVYENPDERRENFEVVTLYAGVTEDGETYFGETPPTVCGVYEEIAYVKMELDSEMQIGEPIMRTFTILPNVYSVYFETEDGTLSRTGNFKAVYGEDNPINAVVVDDKTGLVEGAEPVLYYAGVNTEVEGYGEATYPEIPGAYVVTAVYYNDEGNKVAVPAVGTLIIDLATLDSFSMGVNEFTYGDIDENTELNAVTATFKGVEYDANELPPEELDYIYLMQARPEYGENNLRLNGVPEDVVELIQKYLPVETDAETGCAMITAAQVDKLLELLPQILTELGMESYWENYQDLLTMAMEMMGVDEDSNILINAPLPVNATDKDGYLLVGFCYSKYYHPAMSVDMDSMSEILNSKLVINPMEIVIKPDNKEKTYGEEDPEFTYQLYIPVKADEEVGEEVKTIEIDGVTYKPVTDLPYEDTITAEGAVSRVDGESAGTYEISVDQKKVLITEQDRNYSVVPKPGTFEIKQKDIYIKGADLEFTYGDSIPEDIKAYTVKDADGNEVSEDLLNELQFGWGGYWEGRVVGNYELDVYANSTEYTNFNIKENKKGTIKVIERDAKILLSNQCVTVGDSYSMFLNKDNLKEEGFLEADWKKIVEDELVTVMLDIQDHLTEISEHLNETNSKYAKSGVIEGAVTGFLSSNVGKNYDLTIVPGTLTIVPRKVALNDVTICVDGDIPNPETLTYTVDPELKTEDVYLNVAVSYVDEVEIKTDDTKTYTDVITARATYNGWDVDVIAGTLKVVDHKDTDKDHICDNGCDETIGTCVDADKDHDCDYGCDKVYGEHVDTDTDHVCDYGCSVAIGTCVDADKDHDCDYGCDKVYGKHEDANKDHACDYGCSVAIGICEDADKDHDCDYGCSKVYGEHVDANKDHACDYCGENVSKHSYGTADTYAYYWNDDRAAADAYRVCLVCGDYDHAKATEQQISCVTVDPTCEGNGTKTYKAKFTFSNGDEAEDYQIDTLAPIGHNYVGEKTLAPTCTTEGVMTFTCEHNADHTYTESIAVLGHVDGNRDHICDRTCGVSVGAHEPAEGGHICDYCGKPASDCVDTDENHECDICGTSMGEHKAAEGKHTCDYCGESLTECTDKDGDENHECDICGEENISECIDSDQDHQCDECGEVMSQCADKNNDGDHNCDVCGKEDITSCEDSDTDTDHNCDDCGKTMSDCVDSDRNHACDICGAVMGKHEAADGKHTCDYCGESLTECTDKDDDGDHDCDVCGKKDITSCEDSDTDTDHNCDDCGKIMSDCVDSNSNHACDVCGAIMGKHEAADGKHTCDYCGESLTECTDKANDDDHNCDICGKENITSCTDENTDHKCDECGETVGKHEAAEGKHTCDYCGETVTTCGDADKDHDCDVCGAVMGEHKATEGEHTCDYCGGTVTTCDDADKDHDCDVCGTSMGEHKAAEGKHTCDYCGKTVTNCDDTDDDHKCDVCGVTVSVCVDNDNDHFCDICGKELGSCEDSDEDKDHNCDLCGKPVSVCTDGNNDHNCDICDKELSTCTDGNKDHKCDTCGKELSGCADGNKDHHCDICGKELSSCTDGNKDHYCDVCGKELSTCTDSNSDHKCDTCGKTISTCADGDSDHKCDTCGKTISACEDGDKDHKCDTCGEVISTCADDDKDHKCDTCGETISVCVDANKDYKCDICGKDMGSHQHQYTSKVTKEATCTEDGVKTFTCSCGDTYTETIKATGHKWGNWIEVEDPTCFFEGLEERKCANCGEKETRTLDVDMHNCPSDAFPDLDNSLWYHLYTDYVISEGLMKGFEDGTFRPNITDNYLTNGNATRAQIVMAIYRMEGSPKVSGTSAYDDVKVGEWYYDAIIWGTQNGIIEGHGDGTFKPNDDVTREQIIAVFQRYSKYLGLDVSASASTDSFVDHGDISPWFTEELKWGVGSGLMTGSYDNGVLKLRPKDSTSRVELAAVLYRFLEEIAK